MWAIVEDAAGDRSSGAAEIARKVAGALGRLPDNSVMPAIERLLRGHPSMAPLWRLATEILSSPDRASAARRFLLLLEADRDAAEALETNVAGRRILTISYSSSILRLVRQARPQAVLCMRSDPGGEGLRAASAMSAWTVANVVEDDEATNDVPADLVVVGADAVTTDSVINKVKTRALAEAARAKGIPTYAVAGEVKFIGAEIPVTTDFEATPLELFSAIAGPQGLWDPPQASAYARGQGIHPDLRRLLVELEDLSH